MKIEEIIKMKMKIITVAVEIKGKTDEEIMKIKILIKCQKVGIVFHNTLKDIKVIIALKSSSTLSLFLQRKTMIKSHFDHSYLQKN